jgi:hypothetical protein
MTSMELKLWPLLYLDVRYLRKPRNTNHHKPAATWKDALPDFRRFDWYICRTESWEKSKLRMPWRLWIYWKDPEGKIWGRHVDWMWFPPRDLGQRRQVSEE